MNSIVLSTMWLEFAPSLSEIPSPMFVAASTLTTVRRVLDEEAPNAYTARP